MLVFFCLMFTAAAISNPFADYRLFRNPKFKNAGKFMTLPEFLALANNASSVSGVLIRIEVSLFYSLFLGSITVFIEFFH